MSQDSKFIQVCYRITDLIIINVIHVICCTPVFTIGAAFSALYTVTIKMAKDEETAPISKEYFRAFQRNFKQATGLWLIVFAFGIALYFDFRIALTVNSVSIRSLFVGLLVAVMIIYLCTISYLFPMIAWFYNTNMRMIKNAFYLSGANLKFTVPIVILNLTPILVIFVPGDYLKWMAALYLFIWFSAVAYWNGKMFRVLFDKLN